MKSSMSDQPSHWKVGLILIAGVLSASTAAIFIRLALKAVEGNSVGFSLVLAASRLTLASLFLIPAWRSFWTTQFQGSALSYSVAAGCCLAVHFASWVTSLSYTSVAASTALVTTNPVWVAILSWLWFGEKPSLKTGLGIAIALIGSLLIGLGSSGGSPVSNPLLGNLLAVAGSVAVSLYFLLGREAQRRGLGISSHIVLTYTTAALVLLPLPLFFGVGYVGYPSQVYLWIVLMAVFPQLIGHTSFNWAVRWISPTLVTLTILAEPVGSGVLALLFFQENPGMQVVFGAVVILVGVAIAALGTTPTAKNTK
ncbi:DMT family transporter [Leptolyngbya sp. FACHB-671]|nr:DMT family transporter [Leptolyngbya sp. FACHB-671]